MIFDKSLRYGYPLETWKNLKNLPNESWIDVNGFKGLFQLSNYGRIKSLHRIVKNGSGYRRKSEKIVLSAPNKKGYYRKNFIKDNKRITFYISRIVALHFSNNINNKSEVNHIDGNKNNNHISNLEWVTRIENITHALRTGLRKIKQVNQTDPISQKVIRIFSNTHEVSKYLNIKYDWAKNIIRLKKIYKGYLWSYK